MSSTNGDEIARLLAQLSAEQHIVVVVRERTLQGNKERQVTFFKGVNAVDAYMKTQGRAVSDRWAVMKGLFYAIIFCAFLLGIACIGAGVFFAYLRATGTIEVDMVGLKVTSTNAAIASVIVGLFIVVGVFKKAMRHIQEILRS